MYTTFYSTDPALQQHMPEVLRLNPKNRARVTLKKKRHPAKPVEAITTEVVAGKEVREPSFSGSSCARKKEVRMIENGLEARLWSIERNTLHHWTKRAHESNSRNQRCNRRNLRRSEPTRFELV
ncbi:MAG: hypothetical protein H6780_03375 [Candidatus Nomurabacteria bacterium]|nr:MAG: hypothetical protein H6780_03375 [Candidatus Nomurabacteria bacterium]